MIIGVLGLFVVVMLAYIRFAPSDVARWHTPISSSEDRRFAGGAIRVIDADQDVLQRLIDIALMTPRTSLLAGDAESGLVTFVTRSRWIAFPDYTTLQLVDGQVRLHARLRFGKSDIGVNAARLESWINQL